MRRDGKLAPATWGEAFAAIKDAVADADGNVAAVAGDLAPTEAMFALKDLMARLGSDRIECRQDGAKLPIGNRSAYVGTAAIEDLDSAHVMIIGANPRSEAPILNTRIRKSWLAGNSVTLLGESVDLTYDYEHLGDDPTFLDRIGPPPEGAQPVFVLGQSVLVRPDADAILGRVMNLVEQYDAKLMVLHTAAARVGGMDLGFAHADGLATLSGAGFVFNLGADEIEIADGPFVVYQGSHGDRGAHRADVILPGAAYTEQSGIFVNTEGRPQMAHRAGFPPGDAREDWSILRALSAELGRTLPYDSLAVLRAAMFEAHPHLAAIDQVPENDLMPVESGEIDATPLRLAMHDHYLTNPILRASQTMAELSQLAAARNQAIAAE